MSKSSILILLATQPWAGMSWVTNPQLQKLLPSLGRARASSSSRLAGGPFFGPEEEFACPDKEECEIDWDAMPGFEDVEETSEKEETSVIDANSFGSQALASLQKAAVRLEMSWQIDECKTDQDRCEDFCADCAGSGTRYCRFCRGTGITALGDEFRPCVICKNGLEQCASCRGTGHIAPWAMTMENFLDGKSI
jgi:hypothetical protein